MVRQSSPQVMLTEAQVEWNAYPLEIELSQDKECRSCHLRIKAGHRAIRISPIGVYMDVTRVWRNNYYYHPSCYRGK